MVVGYCHSLLRVGGHVAVRVVGVAARADAAMLSLRTAASDRNPSVHASTAINEQPRFSKDSTVGTPAGQMVFQLEDPVPASEEERSTKNFRTL